MGEGTTTRMYPSRTIEKMSHAIRKGDVGCSISGGCGGPGSLGGSTGTSLAVT